MALPVYDFAPTAIKPRTGEPYVSEASNLKFLGQPRGVYMGFTPQVSAGSLLLTLAVDATYGVSFARVRSNIDVTNVDVVVTQAVTLDFTGHDFLLNPVVHVKTRANSKLGSPTTAEVFTSVPGPIPATEALICVVTKPGANLVADFDAPTNRTTPYAYASAPLGYGFMRAGAIEELLAAVQMVSEIVAARTDLDGVYHPYNPPFNYGLHERIVADLQPAAIASRLGLVLNVTRSEDYVAPATSDVFNVSSSFAKAGRTRGPLKTIPPNGSETSAGAITEPTDLLRNVCFVQQDGTNSRPIDTDRYVGFGRLVCLEQALTGNLTFSNVSTAVSGSGTAFLTEIAAGDIIRAPDNEFYVVASVGSNIALNLTSIPTLGGIIGSTRRRFELHVVKNLGAGEIPHSIPNGATFRFFFPAYFDLSASIHDATLMMFEGGEEPPLPVAAVGVKGKVRMYSGLTDALGGAVRHVKDGGSPVGSDASVYSMNFDSAAVGAPGVANITAAGPVGPIGAPGTGPGPPGPPGGPGAAFDNFSQPFNASSDFIPPFGGWASAQVHSYGVNYPSAPKYVHGGVSWWAVNAILADFSDHWEITSVTVVGTFAEIKVTMPDWGSYPPPAVASLALFLNAAG